MWSIFKRTVSEDIRQDTTQTIHKNAMNNLVTPNSIVEFTIPRLKADDDQEMQQHQLDTQNDNFLPPAAASDRGIPIPGARDAGIAKHLHESSSSRSIKSRFQLKKLESRSSSPVSHTIPHVIETSCQSQSPARNIREHGEYKGMSLGHLHETTGGFLCLRESPNTKRKESLFLVQNDATRRSFKKNGSQRTPISAHERSSGTDENVFNFGYSPQTSPKTTKSRSSSFKSKRRHKEKVSQLVSTSSEETGSVGASEIDEALSSPPVVDVDQDLNGKPLPADYPSIHLSVLYSPADKRVEICILQGKDFTRRQPFYLKVSLLPQDVSYRSESIKPDDTNPAIQENFRFENIEESDIPLTCLKICCKKVTRIGHSGVIGEGLLPLLDIRPQINEFWLPLKHAEEEDTPHILLSVCYDEMLRCLTIDVTAARSVPKGKLGRLPDTFVALTEQGLDSRASRKHTKTIQRTQYPVYQESFLFSFLDDDGSDNLVIVASLFAKDRVRGTAELVGTVEIGQRIGTPLAQSQIAKAVLQIKKPVTCWHPLKAPESCS